MGAEGPPEGPTAASEAPEPARKRPTLGGMATGVATWFTPAPPPPAPTAADVECPEEYIDPISQELMIDPVLLVETGQSYERSTIEMWFQQCRECDRPCTDPLTRKVLRHTTMVPNFSLKSLVASWAERHRIADLSTFSADVGRQRTLARIPAEQLAALHLSGSSPDGSPQQNKVSPGRRERLYPMLSILREGSEDGAAAAPAGPPPPARPAAGAVVAAAAAAAAEARAPASSRGVYPSMQPGTSPPASRKEQAEVALAALRGAASPGGGSGGGDRGAAPYHAWTLMQLAADADGRRLLWEGNAIPLTVFLLGQPPPPDGGAALDAAKPALCGTLQRLAARDRDVASSIAQCGGIQALVQQLTASEPERRAAACNSLYFLGWQGPPLRAAIYAALSEHAAASRLPPKPLMAFWRFWEQQQQQPTAASSLADGGADSASSPLAVGREAEWDSLSLLLHMLAEGTTGASGQQQLAALEASGTAVPAVLAHGAVQGGDAAVQFASAKAAALLSQLPANLPLLLDAALLEGQQAASQSNAEGSPSGGGTACVGGACESAAGRAAGEAARLLWELSYSPAGSGSSFPRAVQLIQQQGALLLPGLEAALDPEQGRTAGCRWLAAGLLACLTFEPAQQQSAAGAAAAADGMRCLLAAPAAAGTLHRLLSLLQPDVAAAHPQAAHAAALAVANMAAYRGLVAAASDRPPLPEASAGVRAKLTGLTNRLLRSSPGPSPHASGDHAAAVGSAWGEGSGDYGAALEEASGEPRAALLQHGAMQKLLRLVLHCSAAAAAADATAAAASRAPAAPVLVQPTPLAQPTAAQQAAAAAAAAAESAAAQRSVLVAALQAMNNLCADPAVACRLQRWSRPNAESHQRLTATLMGAMSDARLPPATREHARQLLHTESGAPGQRHSLVCCVLPPPARAAAYPNP